MIVYEEATFDPTVTNARLAVLEAMELGMKCHCYSSVDALEETLKEVYDELSMIRRTNIMDGPIPDGLTRIALIFTDPRAISVVAKYMAPGFEFSAWPQPDAWLALYQQIDGLRVRARRYDPQFVPRHI